MTRRASPPGATWLVALVALLLAAGCGSSNSGDGDDTSDDRDEAGQTAESADTNGTTETVEEDAVEDGDVEPTRLELMEVGGSGVTGVARVSSGSSDSLAVEVELEGHRSTHGIEARAGSCDEATDGTADGLLEGATTFTLKDVEDGTMQDEVQVRSDLVSQGTYSLVVYAGPEVEGDVAACAEVKVD